MERILRKNYWIFFFNNQRQSSSYSIAFTIDKPMNTQSCCCIRKVNGREEKVFCLSDNLLRIFPFFLLFAAVVRHWARIYSQHDRPVHRFRWYSNSSRLESLSSAVDISVNKMMIMRKLKIFKAEKSILKRIGKFFFFSLGRRMSRKFFIYLSYRYRVEKKVSWMMSISIVSRPLTSAKRSWNVICHVTRLKQWERWNWKKWREDENITKSQFWILINFLLPLSNLQSERKVRWEFSQGLEHCR